MSVPGAAAPESLRLAARSLLLNAGAPSSTYRLQLRAGFGFREAAEIVPYLQELGVGAVYFSPYFRARPGSTSGYDVTDPNELNPELGGEADFDLLCERLAAAGIGHVADVVPNHMGAGDDNPYWTDVLEKGRRSRYASFFDIDWSPVKPELNGKVLLPVLGDFYGRELAAARLAVGFERGRFFVRVPGARLPAAPSSWPLVLEPGLEDETAGLARAEVDALREASGLAAHGEGDRAAERLDALAGRSPRARAYLERRVALFNAPDGGEDRCDRMDAFLSRQAYRLAHWRVAADEINYRRFFDLNQLAALRVEDPEVFAATHRLVFRLLDEGKVQGLRIDHPDGLYAPAEYFARLQEGWLRRRLAPHAAAPEQVDALLAEEEFRGCAPLFVVVEKILGPGESLPDDWRVRGTVGYEALVATNGLFVDGAAETAMGDAYHEFTGAARDFAALRDEAKRHFLKVYMAGEIESLGHRLDKISEGNRDYRDFTRRSLTAAVRAAIECFPVYRTYIGPGDAAPSERDERYVRVAIARARRAAPYLDPALFDFLQDVLLLKVESASPERDRPLYRDFVLRFQQLTAPAMAKGLEDTAFYEDGRLVSLNEVGGDPGRFGCPLEEYHRRNLERGRRWPSGLVPSSTHDTKRGEDVRLRIDALSELPAEWRAEVARWAALNDRHKTELDGRREPDRDTEYFLYQTLAGFWPDAEPEGAAREALVRRLRDYALKSVREAKRRTSWVRPDAEYEAAVDRFLSEALRPSEDNAFLAALRPFARRTAALGRRSALSALALKLASPGVADVYQGTELWDDSLVDPDNRRPVDFAARAAALRGLDALLRERPRAEAVAALAAAPEDGRIKLLLLREGLRLRRRWPGLFVGGEYLPLAAEGPRAEQVVAFRRRGAGRTLVAVAGRFFGRLPDGPDAWAGTRVLLPDGSPRAFEDACTRRRVEAADEGGRLALPLDGALAALGCALLVDAP